MEQCGKVYGSVLSYDASSRLTAEMYAKQRIHFKSFDFSNASGSKIYPMDTLNSSFKLK